MHLARAYLAAILLTLLVGTASPACAASASSDAAAHQAAADAARAKAAQQQALARELQAQTRALDNKVQSLQAQADALDPQVQVANRRAKSLQSQVERMRSQVASKSADIANTQAELTREQALLSVRVVSSYKQGGWYYLNLLLDSSNIRDLIARTELLGRVLHAGSDVVAQLDATRHSLETQKTALDHALEGLAAKRQEAAAVKANLNQLQGARQDKVDAQQSVLTQKSHLLAQSEKNAKRLLAVAKSEEAESARIKSELTKTKRGSGKLHGVMAWPVPGFHRITSPFGMRMHPILHVKRMHTGIDIGRNSNKAIAGAAIVAAASGKVVSAGYRSGYGYTVMIDHGNGIVTLYAHQPPGGIKVSKGRHVTKGQRIGTVGMSGYATGPHLHFEVRVNGTPVNPMNYL
jgi:murein DD-endopeptidase MepM/ murein hydrolase activator NlpD